MSSARQAVLVAFVMEARGRVDDVSGRRAVDAAVETRGLTVARLRLAADQTRSAASQ